VGASRHAARCGRFETCSVLWVLQREELLLPEDHVPEEEGVSGVLHEEMFHTCAARQSPGGGLFGGRQAANRRADGQCCAGKVISAVKGSREHIEPEQEQQRLFACAGGSIAVEGWSARCRNPSFKRGSAFVVQETDPDDDKAQRRRIAGTQPGLKGFLARLPALKVRAR